MSEHTKEPWRLGLYPEEMHGKESVLVDLADDRKYVLLTCNLNFPADARANARRIVACVNACAEIPTDDLEESSMTILQYMEDQYADKLELAKQQRDELLDELKNIADARRFNKEHFENDTSFADWAQSRARFAIAKSEA